MDTNQQKDNNTVAVNAFNKGMNSDLSFDLVNSEQYIFGLNIRITNNALIGALIDANSTEGIVTPVVSGKEITITQTVSGYTENVVGIMATASIENDGAIITKIKQNDEYYWSLHKAVFDNDTIKLTHLFTSTQTTDRDRLSVIINKELNDVIKLYIADTKHPVICVNLNDSTEYFDILKEDVSTYDIEDKLCSNRLFPSNKIQILKKISGVLKTSQVLYTYRLYKKYGLTSCLAPMTNKIQIISGSRQSEVGNKKDSQTTIGLQLLINLPEMFFKIYDHIQIYRLSYIEENTDTKIELISDAKINSQQIILNDTGIKANLELSIDEFASLSGQTLIPECIELNQGYMFLGNVIDNSLLRLKDSDGNQLIDTRAFLFNSNKKCVYYKDISYEKDYTANTIDDVDDIYLNKYADINYTEKYEDECKYDSTGLYYGGTGKYVSWNFVVKPICIHTNFGISRDNTDAITHQQSPGVSKDYTSSLIRENKLYKIKKGGTYELVTTTDNYLEDIKLPSIDVFDYNDMFTSSVFRSLKRDEVYRYGIVFYDKYGNRSDTSWIADIRTPTNEECPCTFVEEDYNGMNSLYARTIGILFNVDIDSLSVYNIVGYEIVRCEKTPEYSSIIAQGCLSRPVRQQYVEGDGKIEYEDLGTLTFDISTKTFSYYSSDVIVGRYVKCNDKTAVVDSTDETNNTFTVSDDFGLTASGSYQVLIQKNDHYGYTVTSNSPYYPLPIITTKHTFTNGYGQTKDTNYAWNSALSDTERLYLFINIDMLFERNDLESHMTDSSVCLSPVCYIYGKEITEDRKLFTNQNGGKRFMFALNGPDVENDYLGLTGTDDEILYQEVNKKYVKWGRNTGFLNTFASLLTLEYYSNIEKLVLHPATWRYYDDTGVLEYVQRQTGNVTNTVNGKENSNIIFFDYNKMYYSDYTITLDFSNINITTVKDSKDISQLKGFTNVQLSGSDILQVSKSYKSYIDTVGQFEYNNWCSNGVYDLRTTFHDDQTALKGLDNKDDTHLPSYSVYQPVNAGVGDGNDDALNYFTVCNARVRWIGPGSQCFVISTDEPNLNSILRDSLNSYAGTVLCNIKHTAVQFAGLREEDKLYDVYYGFGNFFQEGGQHCVFDGDIYITPCEIVSLYKIYDFNSYWDSLFSSLIMYYMPMESKINTFFDYGLNFLNTSSTNLSIDPTTIDGVKSSDRPQHLYNMIYSLNNTSNNVFNAQSLENDTYEFNNRICYSENKLNGEYIDSWLIFKAVDFIDTDTRWGEVTNLLTAKDILYYWLTYGFGRLTVNERSLVTDENNNTVQLGQGGVLQRTDYIDTKHGMRKQDFCATNTDSGVVWIDMDNKSIVAAQLNQSLNMSESLYVLNILNEKINDSLGIHRPTIDYDILNDELLCKCLNNDNQLIFNLKLNIATSIYTRTYEKIIKFNNQIIGLNSNMSATKYNYLDKTNTDLLSPTLLSFVVNTVPSTTKIFDNQKIVTLKRSYDSTFAPQFLNNKLFVFTTDMEKSTIGNSTIEFITDRENNICYAVPRANDPEDTTMTWGRRMRGKWMKVDIIDRGPSKDFSISHIITKFRLSFS